MEPLVAMVVEAIAYEPYRDPVLDERRVDSQLQDTAVTYDEMVAWRRANGDAASRSQCRAHWADLSAAPPDQPANTDRTILAYLWTLGEAPNDAERDC